MGELFRSQLVQQIAPRNGDFVTPTIVGAAEYDFAERDLRYTRPMFQLLTSDREFGDHNRALMMQWLSAWVPRALHAALRRHPSCSVRLVYHIPDSIQGAAGLTSRPPLHCVERRGRTCVAAEGIRVTVVV